MCEGPLDDSGAVAGCDDTDPVSRLPSAADSSVPELFAIPIRQVDILDFSTLEQDSTTDNYFTSCGYMTTDADEYLPEDNDNFGMDLFNLLAGDTSAASTSNLSNSDSDSSVHSLQVRCVDFDNGLPEHELVQACIDKQPSPTRCLDALSLML